MHLRFNRIDESIFVLASLAPFVIDRRLSVTGLLATKRHAILDRGTRRDFFDLYVVLHRFGLGIAECLSAESSTSSAPPERRRWPAGGFAGCCGRGVTAGPVRRRGTSPRFRP